MVAKTVERRKHPRYRLSDSLRMTHELSGRQWPGRAIDASAGGMQLALPAAVPVRPGHQVTLRLAKVSDDRLAFLADSPAVGHVVRVDREKLLNEGYIAVAVAFDGDQASQS